MPNETSEFLRQVLFLDSILAGFAFAIVAQLLVSTEKTITISRAITALLISSFLLLLGTIAQVLMLVALSSNQATTTPAATQLGIGMGVFIGFISLLGLIAFLIGIGLSGWIYSKRIGILSTVFMAVSILIVVILIIAVSSLNSP